MKKSILELLEEAGAEGMTISEISERLEVQKTRVQNWFTATGKRTEGLRKIGVGRWKFAGKSSSS